jgi:hypothetical protein
MHASHTKTASVVSRILLVVALAGALVYGEEWVTDPCRIDICVGVADPAPTPPPGPTS